MIKMCTQPNYAMYVKSNNPEEPGHLKFIQKLDNNYRTLKERYGNFLVSLPCGKCEECKRNYASEWATRAELEARKHPGKNWFLTLTYAPNYLPKTIKQWREDIQNFINNLINGDNSNGHRRKKTTLKYWIAGEYGPLNNRPHNHMILFNLKLDDVKAAGLYMGNAAYQSDTIQKAWAKGFYFLEEANKNTAAYCAKYATKDDTPGFRPMMSKGLGWDELIKEKDFIVKYGYIQGEKGKKLKIPRYFFKKFSEDLEVQKRKIKQIEIGDYNTSKLDRIDRLEHNLKQKDILHKKQKGRRAKA